MNHDAAPLTPHDPRAWNALINPRPRPLERAVQTDTLGAHVVYHAVIDGRIHVCSSAGRLARQLPKARVDTTGFVELHLLGCMLDDRTLLREVRCLPPGATLHPDGRVQAGPPPRTTGEIDDERQAHDALEQAMLAVRDMLEDAYPTHLCGLSSGKDTRMLAALPKRHPDRWHWLNISGADSGEHRGAFYHAQRLNLRHVHHLPWGLESMTREAYRQGCLLVGGAWTVSETNKWRYYFKQFVQERQLDPKAICIWAGTVGDGLIGPSLILGDEQRLWEALASQTRQIASFWRETGMALPLVERFEQESVTFRLFEGLGATHRPWDGGMLIRQLTRGRYVCQGMVSLQDVSWNLVHPFCHPAVLDVVHRIDTELYRRDAIRDGLLERWAKGSSAVNEKGFAPPDYGPGLIRDLQEEARQCPLLDDLLDAAYLANLRLDLLPRRLTARAKDAPLSEAASLRIHDKLLGSVAYFNQLREEGVALTV